MLPTEPLLNLALYAGLASLKLPSCYDQATKNIDCPVCDADLGTLAEEVPLSHHVNSTIVCRLSGKIMDEDNMPMAFPNGYVYSREVSWTLKQYIQSIADIATFEGIGRDGSKEWWNGDLPAVRHDMSVFGIEESLHLVTAVDA
jgi:hypothetical protein